MTHFFFFGDSITLGVGEPGTGGWVGRFANGLAEQGRLPGDPSTFYNLGVRKASSRQILHRWEAEFRVRRGNQETDSCLLLFSFGVVDMAAPGGSVNIPVEASVDIARKLLCSARETAPVLLLGPTPVASREHSARIGELSAAYGALCSREGIPFADLFTHLTATENYVEGLSDGVHPGAAGNAQIAACLLKNKDVGRWMGEGSILESRQSE